jgi:signal transduction histidine kinase
MELDRQKIRQVVMNLVDNAIKYTPKGEVRAELFRKNGEIVFCIKDSGVGISKTDLPNLFKKFSRGTGMFQVHTEGTGLGLFVAKQLVEAHKGKIWAESEGENKGAAFCFSIPVGKAKNN